MKNPTVQRLLRPSLNRTVASLSLIMASLGAALAWAASVFLERSSSQSIIPTLAPVPALVFVAIAATVIWLVLVSVVSYATRRDTAISRWAERFRQLLSIRDGGRWIAGWAGVALILAFPALLDGRLNPWLWMSAAFLSVGLATGTPSPRRGTVAPLLVAAGTAGPTERPGDWWEQLLRSTTDRPRRARSFAGTQIFSGTDLPGSVGFDVLAGPTGVPNSVRRAFDDIRNREEAGRPISVLGMPRGSGLMSIVTALAFAAISERQQHVLVLAPDGTSADLAFQAVTSRLAADPRWLSTTNIGRVGGSEGVLPASLEGLDRMPHLLIATPDELDRVLRSSASAGWQDWWRVLGLVILTEADTYVGATGSHLALLLRRLQAVCRRLRAVPTYLVECPGGADRRAFIGRLTGLDVDAAAMVKVPEANPRVVDVWEWPTTDTGPVSMAEAMGIVIPAVAEGASVCLILGEDSVSVGDVEAARSQMARQVASDAPGRWEVERDPKLMVGPIGSFDVAVVLGFRPSWARLRHQYGMLGSLSTAAAPARLILVSATGSAVAFLARDESDQRDPQLGYQADNHSVLSLQLRAMIGSGSWLASELTQLGDVGPILKNWKDLGYWTPSIGIDPLVAAESIHAGFFRPGLDLDSTDEAVVPVFRMGATHEPIDRIDAVSALNRGYRGSLVLIQGDRYEVTSVSAGAAGVTELVVEQSASTAMMTVPVYSVEILREDPASPTDRVTRGALLIDRDRVTVTGALHGYVTRRLSGRAEPRITHFDVAVDGSPFSTRALSLAIDTGKPISTKAAHGAAHAIRTAAHLMVEFQDGDLGMDVVAKCARLNDLTAISAYDRAPGGLGLVQSLDSQLDDVLRLALDLVSTCPCAAGCWRCIDNPSCSAGQVVAELDKGAAFEYLQLAVARQ